MIEIDPVVRHMLLCEDVQPNPEVAEKKNILGLVNAIRSKSTPAFPYRQPELCVYLQVAGGRGHGTARIVAVQADTEQAVFASPPYSITFGTNPLAVLGITVRLRGCVFPASGLYWIQFRYNEKILSQQPLVLR